MLSFGRMENVTLQQHFFCGGIAWRSYFNDSYLVDHGPRGEILICLFRLITKWTKWNQKILIPEQEILAACLHFTATPSTAHCNLYFTLCRTKYIAYVREHWRCQSWKQIHCCTVSSKDTTVSKTNYYFSNQDSCSEGTENEGGGEVWCRKWEVG